MNVLREYMNQRRILEILDDPHYVDFTPLQREFLRLTTSSRLAGKDKKDGILAFNQTYGCHYTFTHVMHLEQKALEGWIRYESLVQTERKIRIQALLDNPSLISTLSQKLADVVYAFHVSGETMKSIADQLGVDLYSLGETRRMLDVIIVNNDGTLPKRGEITTDMIDNAFSNNSLPPVIMELLQKFVEGKELKDIVKESQTKYKLRIDGLGYMRHLADETVKEYQQARGSQSR